jgi:glucose/arabinose dehydrogenase
VSRPALRAHLAPLLAAGLALLPAAAPAQTGEPGEPFAVAGPLGGLVPRQLAEGLPASVTVITHTNLPGDDRLILGLRGGRVVVWTAGGLLPTPLLNLHAKVGTNGEGGLLGLAFHPRFAENGLFFVHYTDSAVRTVLARYRILPNNPNRADPASAAILLALDNPTANHKGGQLAFGPDGYLYLSVGDGGGPCRSQRRDHLEGKILRLDIDRAEGGRAYAIPPDNPFRNGPFLPEVWATGLRNPWRFSFDRLTGDLWIGDVGQGAREEIDVQPAGQGGVNWGWSPMEGSLCFGDNGCPASVPACGAPGLALPVLEYAHRDGNCSVTGGFVYRGAAGPRLTGTYLFGDFCSGRIWGAARQGGGFEVRELAERVRFLTTFGEDRTGEIYLGTADGRLLRLDHDTPPDRVALFEPAPSRFLLKAANEPGAAGVRFGFGRAQSGWLPLAGDWDGDGRDSVGFYDPARGLFRLRNALSPGVSDYLFAFGPRNAGWLPVVGDWNGDGRDGIGVYDPANSVFHLRNALSSGPANRIVALGPAGGGWLPVAGQFDRAAGDDIGLYDPAAAAFHLQTEEGERVENFGSPNSGWIPLTGDWSGDGIDGIGLYDPGASRFHLDDLNGQPELVFRVEPGAQDRLPLAGAW